MKKKKEKTQTLDRPKSIPQQLWYASKVVVMFFFILFCFFNGVASQIMPSLYFRLIQGDARAEVEFIKTARLMPEFQKLFPEIRQTFVKHETEVYADERKRRLTITELEKILQENPQSRDALYALAILHKRNGNEEKAFEYYEKAKTLDPLLGELQ